MGAGRKICAFDTKKLEKCYFKMEIIMSDRGEKGVDLNTESGLKSELFEESAVVSLKKKLEEVTKERDEARLRCMVKDRALWLWLCPNENFNEALDRCAEMGLPRELKSAVVHALSPACALPMLARKSTNETD